MSILGTPRHWVAPCFPKLRWSELEQHAQVSPTLVDLVARWLVERPLV